MGEQISIDQLAELHLLEAAYGGQSILDYIPRVSPIMPGGITTVAPNHLLALTEQIALAEYRPVRVCVSVPPRHSKTETVLHTIAWWLQRHPEHTIAYCSYSGDIAQSKSVRARDIAEASGVVIRPDQSRAGQWRTWSGGGLIATGVGGPLTGMGANLIMVDDPVKNREEAESAGQRQKLWDWFTSTVMTRLTPGGSIIVLHTRWHSDDLIGRLSKKGWVTVNLPAYDDQTDKWLWPEGGWTGEVLEERRREIGEYDWSSLYMGEPRPRGGRMFEDPMFYDKPAVIGSKIMIACDPAATKSTHADYSVIIVGACWIGPDNMPHVDVLEVWRAQVEIPRLCQALQHFQEQYGGVIGVEATAGFKAIPQTLRQVLKGVRIVEVPAIKDKFTRALPAAAAWNGLPGQPETRRIRLPKRGTKPWLDAFMQEVSDFTGVADPQDDQVDALAHLYFMAATMIGTRKTTTDLSRYLPFG